MQFPDFKNLPITLQAQTLCRHGVYLSERMVGDYVVALYALHGFYAEVHYRFQDSEVLFITSFHDTRLLEPYLAGIRLDGLLEAAPCGGCSR